MTTLTSREHEVKKLSSASYGAHMLGRFSEFRDDRLFCDFTISLDKESFKVHRMVLAGCFDYFRAMFSHGMLECRSDSLELKGLPVSGMRTLLEYAYSGDLHVSQETLPEVLAVASFLQSTHALGLCADFLKAHLTFDNMDHLVNMATTYGLLEIRDHQRHLILENFLEFAETEHFLALDAPVLASYLASDSLRTTTEGQLLKHVLRWYKHDRSARESCVHQVLEYVRYTLDGWPTIEHALDQEVFQRNKKCKELIEFACNYMKNAHRKHMYQSHRTRVRYDKKTLVQMGGTIHMDYIPDELEDSEEGGSGLNHYYHPPLKRWFPLGVLGRTENRDYNHIVSVNDFGIMVGGYIYSHSFTRHATNEVKLFTPGGFALWDLDYLHTPRSKHCVVHATGYIYAVGGHNDDEPLSSVEVFDLDKDKWRFTKPLKKTLYHHAGAGYNGKVYVSGGIEDGVVTNRLLCFDPERKKWREKAPLLTARCCHAMAELGKALIVCGGRPHTENIRCLSSAETYDFELNQWTFLTPMRIDCCSMTAIVLDESLLIVGGETSLLDLVSEVQQYDPKEKKWGIYCHLPYPAKNLGCVAVTVKLSDDGTEEIDSLAEAYEAKCIEMGEGPGMWFGESDSENYAEDLYYYSEEDEDALEAEVEQWRWQMP